MLKDGNLAGKRHSDGIDIAFNSKFAFSIVYHMDYVYAEKQNEMKQTGNQKTDDINNEKFRIHMQNHAAAENPEELCKDCENRIIYAEDEDNAENIAGGLQEKWGGKTFMKRGERYIVFYVKAQKVLIQDLENATKIKNLSDMENLTGNFKIQSHEIDRER